MKIHAYQIAPEYQESPLELDASQPLEGLEIYGNFRDIRVTSRMFDRVYNDLETGEFWDEDWENIPASDMEKLNRLAAQYGRPRVDNREILAKALSIATGKEWDYMNIHGSCQSDWQTIYFQPDLWTGIALHDFEVEYFNSGEEWRLVDETGEDWGTLYSHGDSLEDTRAEIVVCVGVASSDIVLHIFDGWERRPKYVEA